MTTNLVSKVIQTDMTAAYTSGIVRVFFFQAEDGIRDVAVTGVQTCALPILNCRLLAGLSPLECAVPSKHRVLPGFGRSCPSVTSLECALTKRAVVTPLECAVQIGRASCRERV